MDNRGQGALEYLLLIGGAVLIAAVVISLLVSMAGQGTNSADQASHALSQSYHELSGLINSV